MSVIFSLYSAVFMITVALPLSAGSMMMEFSFFSVCRATLSPLLMLDFGSLARLMLRKTSPLSSCACLCHIFRDYLSAGYDFFDREGSRSNGEV